ncbi:MAG TPA: hypothetical protein VFX02_05525 [Gammaproteobacteria bacterium]|nr:hypothetical protein [Gammaproteobacteria bacterium]
MDQKSESGSMHGRLAWMISAWYLFVLWSWSVPLYARNEELFAVSVVIMLSGIVLAVVSFGRFLYELRQSAQRQSPPDSDFIIRVLIDLGALTVLSRFSVTMNRIAEGLDDNAVLLLVAGVIMLTVIYGVIRVVIGVNSVRGYFAARWRAAAAIILALAVAGAWRDVLRSLMLALAALGVEGPNAVPRHMALNALWFEGYVFSLALLAIFLVMLAASWRQFRMIASDLSGLAARMGSALRPRPIPKKSKTAERAGNGNAVAAPVRAARGRKAAVKGASGI